jgi:AraC-like DNA-binding protein
MPSSTVRTFTDPDAYAAAIRQGTHKITITARGSFSARLTRIDFHRLWMQRFAENLPRASHVDGWGGRAVIAFSTRFGPSVVRSGTELSPTGISRLTPGQSYYQYSAGDASIASMSLPLEDMARAAVALTGSDSPPARNAVTFAPAPYAMMRLQHLHAAAGHLAEYAPDVLAHPEAARGLEQALVEAMVACIGVGEGQEDRAALRQHAAIMRRFHTAIEERPDQALYIPEICSLIAVSERTLRACCQEQLGLSPKQYLLLRRMSLARRALRDSTPNATTVTEVATRYGFWQFGRFAGEYKALFGESPSATLGRSSTIAVSRSAIFAETA